jgi:hypothetical protein
MTGLHLLPPRRAGPLTHIMFHKNLISLTGSIVIWERLAVSKQTMQKFDIERFNFKKLDEVDGKEQYRV